MRILVATVQVPFIHGGAEALTSGLCSALRRHGHETDIATIPFRFDPPGEVERSMRAWLGEEFERLNGYNCDRVICLKFPAYLSQHPRKVLWLLHQHRSVYELWDTNASHSPDEMKLRSQIIDLDQKVLRTIPHRYTISRNVAARMEKYSGVSAEALYPPPTLAGRLYSAPDEMFIFCPSRLEYLKRQSLLIEAMQHIETPVVALIAGSGGHEAHYRALVMRHRVYDRVRILGRIDVEQLLACYALCLGVFYGPFDEDLGYVGLETMLAAKPLITCSDSGGPLEYVRHGETGFVVEPDPRSIAQAIDRLAVNRQAARDMGQAGLAHYHAMNISWDTVVEHLIQE